jgi:hypothetical protein
MGNPLKDTLICHTDDQAMATWTTACSSYLPFTLSPSMKTVLCMVILTKLMVVVEDVAFDVTEGGT